MKEFCKRLFLPPHCPYCNAVLGFEPECERCRTALPRLVCGPEPIACRKGLFLKKVHAVYDYEPPIQNAVWRLKFNDEPDLAEIFGSEMACLFRKCELRADALVPVPSSRRKQKARGYSAPMLLAQQMGRELGIPVLLVLEKVLETPDQHGLTRRERRVNLLGTFDVTDAQAVRNKRILLVDDVFTTGSTLDECAKMLLAAGAEQCDALCFARTKDKEPGKT